MISLRVASVAVSIALGACSNRPPPAPPAAEPAPAPAPMADVTKAPPAPSEAETADPAPAIDPIDAAVAAEDREPGDRDLDAGRHPAETLRFFGIAPGMRVAEIAAGAGYTTELLSRTVGPDGAVFAVNNRFVLQKFADAPLTKRLAKPALKNVVRVDREFDAPLAKNVTSLDAVLNVLFYHDTYWMKVDRAKMNRVIFAALKPGGIYGIVDHAAAKGAGAKHVKTLHRVEKSAVIKDIEAAGFKLETEGDFLANPQDKHDWSASPSTAGDKRGTSDRFVLKFVKPAS